VRSNGSQTGQPKIAIKRTLLLLFFAVPLHAQTTMPDNAVPNYTPITAAQRGKWFVKSTVGPGSLLLSGPLGAAWGTMLNRPREYGPHWEGFGKRYGMRLTGVSVGDAMEAGLGALWREDPRYFRSPDRAFGLRVEHIIKTSFEAPGRDGRYRLAYARFVANAGNNFLSNTWRASGDAEASDAVVRCLWGIAGRAASNAFAEFWPDIAKRVFRRKGPFAP
jgi:hypothetical protein